MCLWGWWYKHTWCTASHIEVQHNSIDMQYLIMKINDYATTLCIYHALCFTVNLEYTTVCKLKPHRKIICTFCQQQPYTSSFATFPDCIRRLWGVTMQVWVSVLWEVHAGWNCRVTHFLENISVVKQCMTVLSLMVGSFKGGRKIGSLKIYS